MFAVKPSSRNWSKRFLNRACWGFYVLLLHLLFLRKFPVQFCRFRDCRKYKVYLWGRGITGRMLACRVHPNSTIIIIIIIIIIITNSITGEESLGTTDNFTASFLHFPLFSTALWDFPNSRPVHSLMLSSYLFLFLPCLLPPFTVPCKMVLARPDERETWPYLCSLRFFTIVRKSSCDPIACWILARTSSLVTWSLYEMRSILR